MKFIIPYRIRCGRSIEGYRSLLPPKVFGCEMYSQLKKYLPGGGE